ncbi:biotin--[acetyl-CoA-carboxylase] ligase [Aphanothece sacrum]|uniref:Biotin n=1 Tax=Aphanothece sacrum FPU1 TaxID=1920663 RepID=A0A401ILV8_APHSA|nr:biotin--[acetyl-CoA-carboxylase] ligase [Aphanothece sacrum]GBF82227.1 biotin [Aphanothece sacrum FPU1]GBF87235.1 biotin [Aphanothece sacrum FPU3]
MGFNYAQFIIELANLFDDFPLSPSSVYVFDTIASTNVIVRQLLEQGHKPPLVAIASQQTAGKGQWGRTWYSPPGGLYLSMALDLSLSVQELPHLTLWSSWGIAQILRKYDIPVGLKWPNDLILKGRKLGGIKSETSIYQGRINQGIIGIGINWSNEVPPTGISLQSFWTPHTVPPIASLEQLGAIILTGVFQGYNYYLSQGSDRLLYAYVQLLESMGSSVVVNGVTGIITGVTPQGELKVRFDASGASTEIALPPGTISLGYDTQ